MLDRSFRRLFLRAAPLLRSPQSSTPRLYLDRSRRWYSLHPEQNTEKLQELDHTQLQISKCITPKQCPPPQDLVFGRTFTGTANFLEHTALHMSNCPFRSSVREERLKLNRPHALHRMDRNIRLAPPAHNALPELLPRPGDLRLPLRLHGIRRLESVQRLVESDSPLQTGQEYAAAQ